MITQLFRPLWMLRVALLGMVLGGCAGPVNMHPSMTKSDVIAPSNGVVVARIINTSAYPLPFNYITLVSDNLNASKTIKPERITALPQPNSGSTVFAAQAPPGTYMVSNIRSFYQRGDFWWNRFVNADANLGTFVVEAGKTTDLGALIYYPKSQGDKYFNFLTRIPDTVGGQVLDAHFDFYNYDPEHLLTWSDDGLDNARIDDYASMAQNPAVYRHRTLLQDGRVVFIGKLGVLIIRQANGDYSMEAVDTNLELTEAIETQAGALVIAGPEGKIYYRDIAAQWQDISLPVKYTIGELRVTVDGQVDAITLADNGIVIFRRDVAAKNNDWQELNRYVYETGWVNFPKVSRDKQSSKNTRLKRVLAVRTFEVGGESFVKITHQGLSSDPIMGVTGTDVYQFDPLLWSIQKPESEPDEIREVIAGASKLRIVEAGFWSWDGSPDFYRLNTATGDWEEISSTLYYCDGKTTLDKYCDTGERSTVGNSNRLKSRIKTFGLNSAPVFRNDKDGIASVSVKTTDPWANKVTTEHLLVVTADGGQSWVASPNTFPKPYCVSLVPEIYDRLVVTCNGSSSDIFESEDDGVTWQHVRQHENF